MLDDYTKILYIYVVDRDFGFAPNPFRGYCTLATCKPDIRKSAQIGDWVMGVGGRRLQATGKLIFLMKVSELLTFETYWSDSRFQLKKAVRNGSIVMMVGDNIYHRNAISGDWIQADSHHSNSDGSTNHTNLRRDTKSTNVLISNHFYYFGKAAPPIVLSSIGYVNGIGHRKMSLKDTNVADFLMKIERDYRENRNLVVADPINFEHAEKRVDQGTGKIA